MSITKFNINADFIAYQQITASGLSYLSGRAYKTEGGIFALCSKGSLKTIINHTEYRIGVNELIVVPPETFVQIQKERMITGYTGRIKITTDVFIPTGNAPCMRFEAERIQFPSAHRCKKIGRASCRERV